MRITTTTKCTYRFIHRQCFEYQKQIYNILCEPEVNKCIFKNKFKNAISYISKHYLEYSYSGIRIG